MSVVNKSPLKGAGLKQETRRKMVSVRVDARTEIEVPADFTAEERQQRIDDFIINRGQRLVK